MTDPVTRPELELLKDWMSVQFDALRKDFSALATTMSDALARGAVRMDGQDKRIEGHDARLKALEAWQSGLSGERRGVVWVSRVIWTVFGAAIVAALAAIFKWEGLMK